MEKEYAGGNSAVPCAQTVHLIQGTVLRMSGLHKETDMLVLYDGLN